MSPPPSLAGFHGSIYARNVMFSFPGDVSPTPEGEPEASYLALFVSMLIQCPSASAREIFKALGCGLLHPAAGIPGSPLPPPASVPGPQEFRLLVKSEPKKWVQPCFLFPLSRAQEISSYTTRTPGLCHPHGTPSGQIHPYLLLVRKLRSVLTMTSVCGPFWLGNHAIVHVLYRD